MATEPHPRTPGHGTFEEVHVPSSFGGYLIKTLLILAGLRVSLYMTWAMVSDLGPPVVPFYPFIFLGEGSPTKIDKPAKKRRNKTVPTYSILSAGPRDTRRACAVSGGRRLEPQRAVPVLHPGESRVSGGVRRVRSGAIGNDGCFQVDHSYCWEEEEHSLVRGIHVGVS